MSAITTYRIGCLVLSMVFSTMLSVSAQSLLDLRQFAFNPVLFNPAYASVEENATFALMHRRQWIDFEDSPVASGFSFRQRFARNGGAGLVFQNQKTLGLRTSDARVVFAYRVQLTKQHSLHFAVAGGIGSNDIDLDGRDYSNDPVVINSARNKIYAQGSFGFLYQFGDFRLGIALPSLVANDTDGNGHLKSHPFQQMLDQIYTIRYRTPSGNYKFSLEPYIVIRQHRDLQRFWDAGTLLHYGDFVWIGAAYHEYQGLALLTGCTIRQMVRIGYDYEIAARRTNAIASPSHEFHLAVIVNQKQQRTSTRHGVRHTTR